jgi:hypothetical protein
MAATQNYITQDAADARYQALGGLSSGTPSNANVADAGTAGVSPSASRADHGHVVPSATPSNIVLTGVNAAGTAATHVRSDHGHAYNPPACRVRHSANQNLTTGVELVVAFNTERYDTDNMHDTVTNNSRITFNTAGLYQVSAAVRIQFNAAGYRQFRVRVNGGAQFFMLTLQDPELGSQPLCFSNSQPWKFAAADYIELMVLQTSGVTPLTLDADPNNGMSEFAATWIGVG